MLSGSCGGRNLSSHSSLTEAAWPWYRGLDASQCGLRTLKLLISTLAVASGIAQRLERWLPLFPYGCLRAFSSWLWLADSLHIDQPVACSLSEGRKGELCRPASGPPVSVLYGQVTAPMLMGPSCPTGSLLGKAAIPLQSYIVLSFIYTDD